MCIMMQTDNEGIEEDAKNGKTQEVVVEHL